MSARDSADCGPGTHLAVLAAGEPVAQPGQLRHAVAGAMPHTSNPSARACALIAARGQHDGVNQQLSRL